MLRRPLFFVSLGLSLAILVSHYFNYVFVAAIFMCLLWLLRYFKRQKELPNRSVEYKAVFLVIVAFAVGTLGYYAYTKEIDTETENLTAASLSGEKSLITGIVSYNEKKQSDSGDTYNQLVVKTDRGTVLVNCSEYTSFTEEKTVPGARVTINGVVQSPKGRRNPGCFDYSLYLKTQGISATMNADSVNVVSEGKSLKTAIFRTRENYIGRVREKTDTETAAMVRAIMFGDKGELDKTLLEEFQKLGTAHVLCISGLHVSAVYMFLNYLWRWRKSWLFFFTMTLFLGVYTIMADFSPSVVRAVLMIMLHIVASITGRRYDLANAAFAVYSAILIVNPYMLFNSGFQMSFLAVLSMTLVMPYIKTFYSGFLLTGLVIQIGLGPYMLWNFNYFSLIALFINVPVIFLTGIIVPLGLINMIPFTPDICYEAFAGLCRIMEWTNSTAVISGVTTFQVASPPVIMLALYYLGLFAFATEEGRLQIMRRRSRKYVLRLGVAVIIASLIFSTAVDDGFRKCNLTFVDVGQGDCICVRGERENLFAKAPVYLIDGGGSDNYNVGRQTLRSYLLKNGMSHVDGAFVTHIHTDHYKGICELAREGMVRKLFLYEGYRNREREIIKDTGLEPEQIVYVTGRQIVDLGHNNGIFRDRNVTLEVLWPQGKSQYEYTKALDDEENENAMSLLMKVVYTDKTHMGESNSVKVLATGDMGEEGEREVIGTVDLNADVLKVGHHGSKYSSTEEFINAVNPVYAVIQVGKNNYGHPAPDTLCRLNDRGIETFRNDTMGAVGFEIRKGAINTIVTIN